MAVAVARALLCAHGRAEDAQAILDAAMASETEIHGRPSGLDHTVAFRGGFGLFSRATGFQPLRSRAPIALVVGHTGRERDTKGRVQRIAELRVERAGEVAERFSAIERLVGRGVLAVTAGQPDELGQAMNENQRHLEALEVSCPEIERMCGIALDAGAVGAKLTGGGGGGCVIALAPGREAAIEAAWARAGHRAFVATIGGVGAASATTASFGIGGAR
jgi:mevalonate kinase